jgi:hypothetical protein
MHQGRQTAQQQVATAGPRRITVQGTRDKELLLEEADKDKRRGRANNIRGQEGQNDHVEWGSNSLLGRGKA